jgi:hypothetical protein
VDDGEEERRRDLPLAAGASELVLAAPIDLIRSLPAHVLVLRLVEVSPAGERPLGQYTFRHSPWPDATVP